MRDIDTLAMNDTYLLERYEMELEDALEIRREQEEGESDD